MIGTLLQRISWTFLLPAALVLAVMPLRPEPHLVEKLRLLGQGLLVRPIDIFDLVLHGGLLLLVFCKFLAGRLDAFRKGQS